MRECECGRDLEEVTTCESTNVFLVVGGREGEGREQNRQKRRDKRGEKREQRGEERRQKRRGIRTITYKIENS